MNRRSFLAGIGAFMVLPGAGRIWKATRAEPPYTCVLLPPTPKTTLFSEIVGLEENGVLLTKVQSAFLRSFLFGDPIPPDLREYANRLNTGPIRIP